ncbi:MAG: AbrB/MazE/SpoVT family DNA-binding domain-containing protein [Anaerolineae bacterium]
MSDVITVKISKRNQIAVPKEVRRRLKLKSGDRLLIDIQGEMAVMLAIPTNYTENLAGLHKEIWQDIDTDAYLQGERESWEG